MADAELTAKIKVDNEVPQAMDKAKSATVSFTKQVDDIQKKFSTAFKDIFLSFLGPMALVGIAANYISKIIEENQRKHAEANQAAIDGTNQLMSAEDRYYANKRNNEKKTKETVEQAKMTRAEVTQAFLQTDPRGQAIFEKALLLPEMKGQYAKPRIAAQIASVQAEVQAIIAEDMKKNPTAGMNPKEAEKFKGPEGFSNVVGVGANPVIEAMAEQLDIQKQQLAALQEIAAKGKDSQTDFTKDSK